MSPQNVFRLLVAAPVALAVAAVAVELLFEDRLPDPLRAWVREQADREPTDGELAALWAGLLFAAAWLGSAVGLLLFWRPARPIRVALVVLGVPLSPALGPAVSAGWGVAVGDLALLLDGAALATAYCWPPVRARFDRPPRAERAGPGDR